MVTLKIALKMINKVPPIDEFEWGSYGAWQNSQYKNGNVMLGYGWTDETGDFAGEEIITKWTTKQLKAFLKHEWEGTWGEILAEPEPLGA